MPHDLFTTIGCGHANTFKSDCFVCHKTKYQILRIQGSSVGDFGESLAGAKYEGITIRGSGSGNGSGDAVDRFGESDEGYGVRNRGSGSGNGSGDAGELFLIR